MKTHLTSLLILSLGLASAQAASIWTSGHGDFGLAYDGTDLEMEVHLHAGAVLDGNPLAADEEHDPADIMVTVANPSAPRQSGAAYNFIGVITGEPVWTLPETEDISRPFLGLAYEELTAGDWSSLVLTLTAMTGPGHFSLWKDSGGTPDPYLVTSDGISMSDSIDLLAGPDHEHYNWAFTLPGIYEVSFSVAGTHIMDGNKTANGTFSFQVAPEPSRAMFMMIGLTSLFMRRKRK